MLVLIVRDGGASRVPREVSGMDEVEALRLQGLEVEVPPPQAEEEDAGQAKAAPDETAPAKAKRTKAA